MKKKLKRNSFTLVLINFFQTLQKYIAYDDKKERSETQFNFNMQPKDSKSYKLQSIKFEL